MTETTSRPEDAKYEGVRLIPIDENLVSLLDDSQDADPSTIIEYLLRDEFCLDTIERSSLSRMEKVRELLIQSMQYDSERINSNSELIGEVEREVDDSELTDYQKSFVEDLERENEIRDEIATVKWTIAQTLEEHIKGGDGIDK